MVSVGTMMEVEPDGTLVVGDFEKILEAGETCSIAGDYVTCTCDEEDSDEECCDCIDQSVPICEGIKCKEAKLRAPSSGSMSNVSGISGLLSPGLMSPMSFGIASVQKKKAKTPLARKATLSPCCPGCLHPSGGPVCSTCGRNMEEKSAAGSMAPSSPGVGGESPRGSPVIAHVVSSRATIEPAYKASSRTTVGKTHRSASRSTIATAHRAIAGAVAEETAGDSLRSPIETEHRAAARALSRSPTGTAHRAPTGVVAGETVGDALRSSARTTYRAAAGASSRSPVGTARRAIPGGAAEESFGELLRSPTGTAHRAAAGALSRSPIGTAHKPATGAAAEETFRESPMSPTGIAHREAVRALPRSPIRTAHKSNAGVAAEETFGESPRSATGTVHRPPAKLLPRSPIGTIHKTIPEAAADTFGESPRSPIGTAHRPTARSLPRSPLGTAHRAGVSSRAPFGTAHRAPAGILSRPISGATSRPPIGSEETAGELLRSPVGIPHKANVDATGKVQASNVSSYAVRTERKPHKKGYGRYNLDSASSDVGRKRNFSKSKKKKQSTRKNEFEHPSSVTRISEGMVQREDTDEVVYEDSERSILNIRNGVIPGMSSKFGSASYAGYSFLAGRGLCGPRVTGLEGSKSAHQVLDVHDMMFVTPAGRRQGHDTTLRGQAISAVDSVDDAKLLLDGLSNSR